MRFSPLALLVVSSGLATPAPVALAQGGTPAAPAATATADLPSGEDLFAKHVAAIGGEDALKAEKNRLTKSTITFVGRPTSGTATVSRVAPDKMYVIVDLPGVVTVETWSDGENAWQRNSNTGTRRLSGDELVQARRDADFLGEANYKARYSELKTTERTTFAQRPAYAVHAVFAGGGERTLFFDAEKGFLIGARAATPQGERTTTFGDYKQFGKAFHPTKTVQKDGQVEMVTTLNSLETDVPSLPSVSPPDEVRKVK